MPTKVLTVGTSQTTLVDYDEKRTAIAIQNITETAAAMAGNAVIYISDESGVTTGKGYAIPPKGYFVIDFSEGFDPRLKYYIISDTATTYVSVLESFLKTKPTYIEEPPEEDVQDAMAKDAPM